MESEYKEILESMSAVVASEFRDEKIPDPELLQMFYNSASDVSVRDPTVQAQVAEELHKLLNAVQSGTRETLPAATYDRVFDQYAQLAAKHTIFPHLVLEASAEAKQSRSRSRMSASEAPLTASGLSVSFTDVVPTPATVLAGQLVDGLGEHYRELLLATKPQQKEERLALVRKLSMLWSATKVWRAVRLWW